MAHVQSEAFCVDKFGNSGRLLGWIVSSPFYVALGVRRDRDSSDDGSDLFHGPNGDRFNSCPGSDFGLQSEAQASF